MSVVDASLYGRLLFGESGHAAVRELLGTGRIVGPPVLRIELANLARRAAKHRALDAAAAARLFDDLTKGVDFVADDAALGQATLALALELDHVAQDCTYLAVARALRMPLVTADAVFARKARRKGHAVEVL
jgi:predicted nucleic acid-binding protein